MRFEGRTALVTGAASGIGRTAAESFAREGAAVVLADFNGEGCEAAAASIRAAGGQAVAIRTDVRDPAACQAMVACAVDTFGGLHIAINNAGRPSAIAADFEAYELDEWNDVMTANVSSVFYSMKAEVPALRASGGTAIINTASVASFIAAPGMAAYVASKHGVAGLTKVAALDLIRHGIRVNAVCPGFVDTTMLRHGFGEESMRDALGAQAPIGRIAEPSEVADVILFLASDAARYMVGSLVRIDGGVTLP